MRPRPQADIRRAIRSWCRKTGHSLREVRLKGSHVAWIIVEDKTGETVGKWVFADYREISPGTQRSSIAALELELKFKLSINHRLATALADFIKFFRDLCG